MTQPFYIRESMAKRLGYWAYQDWLKGKRYLPELEDYAGRVNVPSYADNWADNELPPAWLPPVPEKELPVHAFEQLKSQILYLQNKLNEHIDASKKSKRKSAF